MKRGDIWVVGLDPTEGHEQKERPPVVIVSPEAFDPMTTVPVVLPNAGGGGFAISPWAGSQTMPRPLSWG